MNYVLFQQNVGQQGLFSVQDVRKRFPRFDTRRLVEWQQKGYIQRIVNQWYMFRTTTLAEETLWWTANRIYQPSYLSLETALSFYGLIPEGVYVFTSISSRKTQTFTTPVGTFLYRHVKPAFFFGYQVMRTAATAAAGSLPDRPVLMANVEKTILDYCYLNPHLRTVDDFAATRLNTSQLRHQLNRQRLQTYTDLVGGKQLSHRIAVFRQYIDHYA
ncbi:hypothetical protein DYU11_03330 [Fibrisoma montanum]|uniref:AbiEi antitoxin C-terminal domain-containing protein n=1 Tax=Fibrisoma montanum TaxID=2305895 RepID=A0A418MIS2_9BACT|nr:hypothetical protein [Fibrisoma montanum]RIV27358.1 hypothetical protein DYU11_03330 [Fibrisoma montanum]